MFGPAELAFFSVVINPLVVGLVSGVTLALTYSLINGDLSYTAKFKPNILPALGYCIPIALIGYLTGYLTGISRAPAVGSIVPAVLVLIGGLNIYFFGTDGKNKAIVGYTIFIFALLLLYGVQVGVLDREVGRVARFVDLSDQEKEIRNYRTNIDLLPDPLAWLLTGEPARNETSGCGSYSGRIEAVSASGHKLPLNDVRSGGSFP
jgi:hypothetical protein